jgi:hypothetical protein
VKEILSRWEEGDYNPKTTKVVSKSPFDDDVEFEERLFSCKYDYWRSRD